jgi:hypothetical protein
MVPKAGLETLRKKLFAIKTAGKINRLRNDPPVTHDRKYDYYQNNSNIMFRPFAIFDPENAVFRK